MITMIRSSTEQLSETSFGSSTNVRCSVSIFHKQSQYDLLHIFYSGMRLAISVFGTNAEAPNVKWFQLGIT